MLHAAGLLASPMPSGPLASSWGAPGKGRWITVFANASHAYMIVAGLRFDTSSGGDRWNQGSGPRWRKKKRRAVGFTAKYAPGLLGHRGERYADSRTAKSGCPSHAEKIVQRVLARQGDARIYLMPHRAGLYGAHITTR